MNKANIEELLEQIGLTKSEVKLYLTSLSIGSASAIQLGQKIGISRQMVYSLLPSLQEKGLIKQIEVGTRRYFQAMNPEVLLDRSENIKRKIEEIVPLLQTRQAENNAIPLITVYENPISMREWYRQFMKEAKKGEKLLIWATGNSDYWYRLDPDFYDRYLDHADKIGVDTLMIAAFDDGVEEHKNRVSRAHTQWKYVEKGWNKHSEKWIWRDQICYLTIRENATNMIVIESKALAEIERFDFESIWTQR